MEKKFLSKNKRPISVGAFIAIVIILVLIATTLSQPQRSVASFCKTFKEEKSRLSMLAGSTYPSGVFNKSVSDVGEFVISFDRLEKVAPDEIKGDVSMLKSVYQKIKDDPSNSISASLSGIGAENSVKKWAQNQCNE